MNNPKLEVINGNSFIFKPVYKIKDGKSLLKYVLHQPCKLKLDNYIVTIDLF